VRVRISACILMGALNDKQYVFRKRRLSRIAKRGSAALCLELQMILRAVDGALWIVLGVLRLSRAYTLEPGSRALQRKSSTMSQLNLPSISFRRDVPLLSRPL
jgi:hypothetical protein